MNIDVFQLHKMAVGSFDKIEDRFAVDINKRTIAVSDGATQGYYSGLWAQLLVNEFVAAPQFSKAGLIEKVFAVAADKFEAQLSSMPTSANYAVNMLMQDKKKEGGFATFLGIQLMADNNCKIISCGDSNLFYCPAHSQSVNAFPFNNIDDLNKETSFINSKTILNKQFSPGDLKIMEVRLQPGDQLLLATDAVSRYLLKNENAFSEIKAINDFRALEKFALLKWSNGTLENDDLTMIKIIVETENTITVNQLLPSAGHSKEIAATEEEPGGTIDPPQNNNVMEKVEKQYYELKKELQMLKENAGKIAIRQNYFFVACVFALLITGAMGFLFFSHWQLSKKYDGLIKGYEGKLQTVNDTIERIKKNIPKVPAPLSGEIDKKTAGFDTQNKDVDSTNHKPSSIVNTAGKTLKKTVTKKQSGKDTHKGKSPTGPNTTAAKSVHPTTVKDTKDNNNAHDNGDNKKK